MRQISKILFAIFLSTAVGCSSSEDNNGSQQPAGGPSVTAVTVVETRATSADVQAQVTDAGDTPVTDRGFVYGTSPLPNLNDFATENGAGTGTFSATLDGLQPNTTYYVRAYAINIDAATGNERISYSADKQFQTTAAPALPTVNTLQVTDIKQISAKASGQLVSAGGSSIVELGICFAEATGSVTPTINNWKVPALETAGTFIVTLKGITNNAQWILPGKTYRYRAYARNQEGNVGYGETVEFTNNTNFIMEGPNCTDASGNTYETLILADGIWMTSNLKTTIFSTNNTPLTFAARNSAWWGNINTNSSRYTNPGDASGNVSVHGHLYNGYAAFNTAGLTPVNVPQQTTWRIPTKTDWDNLIAYLGGSAVAGKKLKKPGTWLNDGSNSDDSSGFGAVASGSIGNNGVHVNFGRNAFFWVNDSQNLQAMALSAESSAAAVGPIANLNMVAGISVRCVRDY